MKRTALFIGSHNEEFEVEAPLIPQLLAEAGWRTVIFNPIGGWNWSAIRKMPENDRRSLKQSCIEAGKVIGCEKIMKDYEVSRSFDWRHKVLQETAEVLAETSPDIVFMHWIHDSHFDHRAMVEISLQALRSCANLIDDMNFQCTWKEIWAYPAGRQQSLNFMPDAVACADEKHLQKAMEALDTFSYPEAMKQDWQQWTRQKCRYWAPFDKSYPCADPLKYIGPDFPAAGTLLKEVLGDRLKSLATELWLEAKS